MNMKEALQRIEELERKVRELEARPPQHLHYHYNWQQPTYAPMLPQPWIGPTCIGAAGGMATYGPDH